MKYIIILFLSFYQLDKAIAEDGISVRLIEGHLEKMVKFDAAWEPSFPPKVLRTFVTPQADPSPLSCDITMQNNRKKMHMDYSCDATKTIKTETLSVAVN
jgi:hypothetical protein